MHGHHELVPVKRDVKYFQPAVQSMYPLLTYPFYLSTAEVSSTFVEVGGAAAFCLPWFHPQPITMQRSPKSWHNRTTFPFFAQVFSLQGFSIHLGSKCASCYKTCECGIEQRVDFYKQAKAKTTFWCRPFLLNWFGLLKGNALIVQGIKRWAPGAPAKHGSSVWTAQ